jgi:peptidase E
MIIAIGGGEVSENETYIQTINDLYENLGCKTDTLHLCNTDVNIEEVNESHSLFTLSSL